MKKLVIILVIGLLTFACCKEIYLGPNTLVGMWIIVDVDSCLYPGVGGSPFLHMEPLSSEGYLHFKEDSCGVLSVVGDQITVDSDSIFIWHHDSSHNMIDLSFDSGTTVGIISSQDETSLEVYIRDYNFPPPPFSVIVPYYYLKLIRDLK